MHENTQPSLSGVLLALGAKTGLIALTESVGPEWVDIAVFANRALQEVDSGAHASSAGSATTARHPRRKTVSRNAHGADGSIVSMNARTSNFAPSAVARRCAMTVLKKTGVLL